MKVQARQRRAVLRHSMLLYLMSTFSPSRTCREAAKVAATGREKSFSAARETLLELPQVWPCGKGLSVRLEVHKMPGEAPSANT